MKLIASGVANWAAIVRSPSFSRSSSSQTTTIRPARISSSASSTVANGRLIGATSFSTYFASTSTSRLTGRPGAAVPSVVRSSVSGISDTENESSSIADTVSETPSTAIEPFSTT